MIDPAKLTEQRRATRSPSNPSGCFGCGKRLGPQNWYGLCLRCVARTPKEKRPEFHERHMKRTGRAA